MEYLVMDGGSVATEVWKEFTKYLTVLGRIFELFEYSNKNFQIIIFVFVFRPIKILNIVRIFE